MQVKSVSQDTIINPLITIIIVVYNGESSLEKSILSVLVQSYKNIEFIIIDGGSTDQTIDIIQKYESKISYWESTPDKGIYDAMNKAVSKSTGNWLYFLGSGDLLLDSLTKISPFLINNATVYYGDVFRLDTQMKYDGYFSPYKLAITNICHQAIFYPSSVFKKYRYDLKYKIQADHILNMYCFGDKQFNFKYIPMTISIYEGDGYSARNLDLEYVADRLMIIKGNFSYLIYVYAFLRRKLGILKNKILV